MDIHQYKLVAPSMEYIQSYFEELAERHVDAGFTEENGYTKPDIKYAEKSIQELIEYSKDRAKGINLKSLHRHKTHMYWLIYNGEYIGRSWIVPHKIPESIYQDGNISYDIRKSKRNNGHGNKILELSLQQAKVLGLHEALLICDTENTYSKRIIEKNKGVFEKEVTGKDGKTQFLHYMITL
jgi:predicted acetyltransferase